MNLFRKTILGILVQAIAVTVSAQGFPTNDPLKEVFRISEYYRLAPYLDFSARYVHTDSANPAVVYLRDTVQFKLSAGRFQISGDSTVWLQGGQYQLHVNHREKRVALENILKYPPVIPMALCDPEYRRANVDTMFMMPQAEPLKRLKVRFRETCPYSSIELVFHPSTRRIQSMIYFLREGLASAESGLTRVEVEFSSYETGPFDQLPFKEETYVYWTDGRPMLKPEFSSYTLLSSYLH